MKTRFFAFAALALTLAACNSEYIKCSYYLFFCIFAQ